MSDDGMVTSTAAPSRGTCSETAQLSIRRPPLHLATVFCSGAGATHQYWYMGLLPAWNPDRVTAELLQPGPTYENRRVITSPE